MIAIYPSLVRANLLNLEQDLRELNPLVPGYHLDIMDGRFVPNLSFGPDIIHAISHATPRQLWIHLMVENPSFWIDRLALPHHSIVSFHLESNCKILEIIAQLKEKKLLPSIAINPKTPVADLLPYLNAHVYQILIMSVEPGFSHQQFIPQVLDKIDELKTIAQDRNLSLSFGLDGGINSDTIHLASQYGIEHVVAGSAIFDYPNRAAAYEYIMHEAQRH